MWRYSTSELQYTPEASQMVLQNAIEGHSGRINHLAFASIPGEKDRTPSVVLASASSDNWIKVWRCQELTNGDWKCAFAIKETRDVLWCQVSVDTSQSNRMILYSSGHGYIHQRLFELGSPSQHHHHGDESAQGSEELLCKRMPEDAAARHDERNVMIHKCCLLRIPGGAQENVVLAFGDLTLVSMNRLHS